MIAIADRIVLLHRVPLAGTDGEEAIRVGMLAMAVHLIRPSRMLVPSIKRGDGMRERMVDAIPDGTRRKYSGM